MQSESMYIPQSDEYDVEEVETIEMLGYPDALELDFDEVIVLESSALNWD